MCNGHSEFTQNYSSNTIKCTKATELDAGMDLVVTYVTISCTGSGPPPPLQLGAGDGRAEESY
jgi:hypothetical protein